MQTIQFLGMNIPPLLFPVVMGCLWISAAASLVGWVSHDARARGHDRPVLYALLVAFVPFGVLYYLYWRYRGAGRGRTTPAAKRERLYATWVCATLGSFVSGAVFAPPDPYSIVLFSLGSFVVVLPIAYLLIYREKYHELRMWKNA